MGTGGRVGAAMEGRGGSRDGVKHAGGNETDGREKDTSEEGRVGGWKEICCMEGVKTPIQTNTKP